MAIAGTSEKGIKRIIGDFAVENSKSTEMGVGRIKKNLGLGDIDVVEWCLERIIDNNAKIERNGKNWYVMIDDIVFTVNASSYTIITAHKGTKRLLKAESAVG